MKTCTARDRKAPKKFVKVFLKLSLNSGFISVSFFKVFRLIWVAFSDFLKGPRGICKTVPDVSLSGSLLERILAPRWAKLEARWR